MQSIVGRAALAVGTATVAWLYLNHRRVRRSKNCLRAIRVYPPMGVKRRPHPLVFLSGTSQKADVWRGRMEMLSKDGYECHALDFSQTGRYFTSYEDQLCRIREYILERLEGRPVLIGHSQGGIKAQLYMLATEGDASVDDDMTVRAVVLMASVEHSFLRAIPDSVTTMMATAGTARFLLALMLGTFYLDPLCFIYGGGPWRHQLRMHDALFNAHTARTTLISKHSASDARIQVEGELTSGLSISQWADTYITGHEPAVVDFGVVSQVRSPAEAINANRCSFLHLVAEYDRVVPREQSQKVSDTWGCTMQVIGGQGHQFGDAGWEQSVMPSIKSFLDAL